MNITNSELILSILICENKEISGYKINSLIEKYGYREWAGIGPTSIYKGLKKLKKIGYIESRFDLNKTTKGPVGKIYIITKSGKTQLLEELRSGLSETREHNQRFKIAFSGIDLLEKTEICELLEKRVLFLNSEFKRINTKKKLIEHKILKVQMLFEHSLWAIKSEIKFTTYLIKQYNKE
ncbi:MAG: helix-turn-helix transcriptional regulator [Candidatus Cloacimonetes bacterium]|nr:helix-turn-helix transcriptional regulator [Candidatus Cloacimonadota bacterium]